MATRRSGGSQQTLLTRLVRGGVLIIESGVFVPAEAKVSSDRRPLGVMIDWIEIREAGDR